MCFIVFIIHWAIAYSEPFQTSKIEIFAKVVTSKEVRGNVFARRFKRVLKGSEYATAEYKVNCFASF